MREENEMKLTTARRKFKNQWMVFKINSEKPTVDGVVLGTAKTRKSIFGFMKRERLNDVYVTFNGPAIPRGVAFFF